MTASFRSRASRGGDVLASPGAQPRPSSLPGLWIPAASAVLLLALCLAYGRSPAPLPSTLVLGFVGLALGRFGRTPNAMSLLDWLVLGPYLLAVGCAFGRDLQYAGAPAEIGIAAGAAALAALLPHARRSGPDRLAFLLLVLLYLPTLLLRETVPAQELALFVGAAVLRVALWRARHLQRGELARTRVTSLVLGPAVRAALLASALILLSEGAVAQALRLRVVLEPSFRSLAQRFEGWPAKARAAAEQLEQWIGSWSEPGEIAPVPSGRGPAGIVEGLISGQEPLEPGPVPGLELDRRIRVVEPDRLGFERDVRAPLELPGVPEGIVLASVRSARPLPHAPYLRRTSFEVYHDGAWSFPNPAWVSWSGRSVVETPGSAELWVTSEPGPAGELFVPSPFLGSLTATPLQRDRAGNVRIGRRHAGPVTISAVTWFGPYPVSRPASPRFSANLYQVPEAVLRHPAFRRAIDAVRQRIGDGQRLPDAAVEYCRQTFLYTRKPGHRAEADPVLEFLRTGRGFCQHYASLAALLLRAEGVPVRMAAGLAFGAPRGGAWVYGLENGHAWIEIWLDGIGWVPLDPTAGTRNLETGAPSPSLLGPAPDVAGAEPPAAPRPRDTASGPDAAEAPRQVPGQPPQRPSRDAAVPGSGTGRPEQRVGPPASAPGGEPAAAVPDEPRNGVSPETGAAGSPAAEQDPPGSPPASAADVPERRLPSAFDPAALLRRFLALGDWLVLALGALFSLAGLAVLRRRVRVEESLGERPSLSPRSAVDEFERLTAALGATRSTRESAQLLFELFSHQMAAWGYGRAAHETERDFASAVAAALGGNGARSLDSAVALIEETRYGGLVPAPAQLATLEQSLLGVLRSVGRRLGLRVSTLRGRGGWLAGRARVVR